MTTQTSRTADPSSTRAQKRAASRQDRTKRPPLTSIAKCSSTKEFSADSNKRAHSRNSPSYSNTTVSFCIMTTTPPRTTTTFKSSPAFPRSSVSMTSQNQTFSWRMNCYAQKTHQSTKMTSAIETSTPLRYPMTTLMNTNSLLGKGSYGVHPRRRPSKFFLHQFLKRKPLLAARTTPLKYSLRRKIRVILSRN